MGLDFLAIGFTPDWSRDEMPIMPKKRYDIMRSYMPTKGDHGLDMMLRSCTSQVNLDYSSEIDMVKKLRLSFLFSQLQQHYFLIRHFVKIHLMALVLIEVKFGRILIQTEQAF